MPRYFASNRFRYVLVPLIMSFTLTIGGTNWVTAPNRPSVEDPSISISLTVATPGSFVQVKGSGFYKGSSSCEISSSPAGLFQNAPECFSGLNGNITGIFQISENAKPAYYTISVTHWLTSQYESNATTKTKQNAPQPLQVVPPSVATTQTTTERTTQTKVQSTTLTSTITSGTTITTTSSTGVSVFQTAIASSIAAGITAIVSVANLIGKNAEIRALKQALQQRRKPPDFGSFTVDVRSGIERKES